MLYVEDLHYVFSTNTAIEQDVIVLTVVIANFIFLSANVLHCTFNQSLVVTRIPEVDLQNLRAYKTRIVSNS